jgi:hypothetical protein
VSSKYGEGLGRDVGVGMVCAFLLAVSVNPRRPLFTASETGITGPVLFESGLSEDGTETFLLEVDIVSQRICNGLVAHSFHRNAVRQAVNPCPNARGKDLRPP